MGSVISLQRVMDDSERGFRLCLPRPLPGTLLASIADRFAATMPASLQDRAIHLYAVANSGVPLASAILAFRHLRGMTHSARSLRKPDDLLTIVRPGVYQYIPSDIERLLVPLIVDNSVHSGETIHSVVATMRANNYQVNQMITLVDYEDQLFRQQEESLRREIGIQLLGLFTASEVAVENARQGRRRSSSPSASPYRADTN